MRGRKRNGFEEQRQQISLPVRSLAKATSVRDVADTIDFDGSRDDMCDVCLDLPDNQVPAESGGKNRNGEECIARVQHPRDPRVLRHLSKVTRWR